MAYLHALEVLVLRNPTDLSQKDFFSGMLQGSTGFIKNNALNALKEGT